MQELAVETLESCRDYTPKLIEAINRMVEYMQTGKEQEGLELLQPIFDGLQWLIEAVQGIQKHDVSVNIDTQNITDHFPELEGALEIRDYTLIADLFSYEINPSLKRWLNKMSRYQVH